MQKVKVLWAKVPEGFKRVLHTFWQAALSALLTQLLAAKSSADVKAAVFVAGATGLAAVKASIVN